MNHKKNIIYKISGSFNDSFIIIECENLNYLAKHMFNYLNLFVDIVSFERCGHGIHYEYKTKNSLNIKNGHLHIRSELGGYSKEVGVMYKIK